MGRKPARPRFSPLIRFWLTERAGALGLLFGVLVIMGVAALLLPIAPAQRIDGTVLKLGLRETETGSYPRAVVQLDGRQIALDLRRDSRCAVGDAIYATCSRHALGLRCERATCDGR